MVAKSCRVKGHDLHYSVSDYMPSQPTEAVGCSVVLPVYNEEGNIAALMDEIIAVMTTLPGCSSFEIIGVDDCSKDQSADVMRRVAAQYPCVRVFQHTKNCGQSAALATGFAHARGTVVITMDADRQNDPADIPGLMSALSHSVDAVCGVRQKRQDRWVRRISSRVANGFRNIITGDVLADAGCGLRVMRREAIAELPVFNGLHRFIPTLLRYQGYRVIEYPVGHRSRPWGASKYGIGNRMFRGMLDCLVMRWWKKRMIPGRRVSGTCRHG